MEHNKNRLQKFKNKGKDQNEMRRRRPEVTVELRINKREETILKRRNVDSNTGEDVQLPNTVYVKQLAEAAADSSKPEQQLTAMKSACELISSRKNPPIAVLIKSGILPILVKCLKQRDHTMLQAEASWALYVASGTSSHQRNQDELLRQLHRKIIVLNSEQTTIGEESAINDKLGSNLISKLNDKVRPNEATKLRAYIDDVGHITSLLLSLSERLARADNSLNAIEQNSAEQKTLESKRERLLEQLEEAKRLKQDIGRRGASVSGMLEKNLTADEFADFDYFINMKAKLIADGRDIADKIKCGEEQLTALGEALMQSDC